MLEVSSSAFSRKWRRKSFLSVRYSPRCVSRKKVNYDVSKMSPIYPSRLRALKHTQNEDDTVVVFTTTTTKMPSLSAVSASSFSSFSSSSSSELQKRIKKKKTNVSRGRRGGARGSRGGRFHRTTKAESNTNNGDDSVKIEREGLERREPRRRGPRRKIARVVVNKEEEEEDKEEDKEASKRLVREEGKTNTKTTKNTKKKTSMTMTERWQKDPLSALISIPRIALGAAEELIVEKGGNPSDVLEEIGRNVPRLVSSSPFSSSSNNTNDGDDDTESVENILRDLEREMERLERKGADAARPMREALVKPNVDEETYERYFAYPSSKGEGEEDDEDEDEDEEGGFYDASKDTGSDEEVAKAASDIADALSGMDLADLYAEKKEEKGRSKSEEGERGRRLNVIAESNSRKAEKDGVSPEAVEYTIEENLSNVVMETATVSSTRRRVVSSATSSSATPATTIEISNKYYSSAAISPEERKEEKKEKTTVVSTKDTSSYVQKFNGKWKRDDQLDESKLMDLFEMNRLFRAANSALTQLDVGATTSNFSLKASYGIISVNESYAYDSEVRQNRRDARSGAQFGRATLDAQSESITLESRWTEPLEGNMTETFEVDENNRLVRKAKVTLLNTNKTWEGVYEYKRV